MQRSAVGVLEVGDEVLYFDPDTRPRSAHVTRVVKHVDAHLDIYGSVHWTDEEILLFDNKPPEMVVWKFVFMTENVSDYLTKEDK
jgi:hypothetical protein